MRVTTMARSEAMLERGVTRGVLVLAALSLALSGVGLTACGKDEVKAPEEAPGSRVAIQVSPSSLASVEDVHYTLTVATTAVPPAVVWTRSVTSQAFGDGRGSLTYVGPCDASTPTNTVTVQVDALIGPEGPLTSWADPGPVSQTVACDPNADTQVTFDLTLARAAEQGFVDVAINFGDIFCSAKLDCLEAFLHNASGARDTTIIVALACSSGQGSNTILQLDSPELVCTDGTRTTIDLSAGPGNTGQTGPHVYQVASYRQKEQVPGAEKCAWNTAIGLDLGSFDPSDPVDCVLRARATASPEAWTDAQTPAGAVWPYIEWEVPVVTASVLSCTEHPLDVPGSGVATRYATPEDRKHFAAALDCGACAEAHCAVALQGHLCDGTQSSAAGPVQLRSTPDGVVVVADGVPASAPMLLPEGYALQGCCADPCCDWP